MRVWLCRLLVVCGWLILSTRPGTAQAQVPASPYAVHMEREVIAKMRDGVVLRADVYSPVGDGPFPVLLQRTPYNKRSRPDFGMDAAAKGFIVVIQDVRGRFASDGDWYPFLHESDDGYDTVEWAAALPHANGKVGMFGGSYVGATQMLTAIVHPPHLAGICPVVTASDYHDGWAYQGGAFEQWFNQSWTTGLAQDTTDRLIHKASNSLLGAKTLPLTDYPLFNLGAPLTSQRMTQETAGYYLDWLAHPTLDSYWKRWRIADHYADIQVPALTVAAWYDIFQGGSLRNYLGLHEGAGNAEARTKQRLLVTIGGHAGSGRKIGDIDFGPAALEFNEDRITLDWYQYLFQNAQNEFADASLPVRLFVMGRDEWRNEAAWPLARAKSVTYYLHADANVATHPDAGSLSTSMPGKEPAEAYTYDPADPVPTTGGPLCCDGERLPGGPKDQRTVEARSDVLVYSTPALAADTEVTGPVAVELYAKSSAPDTDFTAKLVDVAPDGFARNLTEGIVRARFRNSPTQEELLTPGDAVKYHIDLWSTSNVFLKGHRIRVEISSSNFPRFDRNMNSGKLAATDTTPLKATNTILHDRAHPSALVLPMIP